MRGFKKLRTNDKTNFQTDFIFVDTEAFRHRHKDGSEHQTLRLGVAKYWNRDTGYTEELVFRKPEEFWDFVEYHASAVPKELIIYAHNFDYDFKILNGLLDLAERGWVAERFWFKSPVFLIHYEKDKKKLLLWDTTNYIQMPLKKIGEMLGITKLEVDFDKATDAQLETYCRRDVSILYNFIKYLSDFLMQHELSRLKPTSASLSFNVFRHKFYNDDPTIYIHDWTKACELERLSYRGGLCDCFRVGEISEKLYKLDVNSMYPYVMSTRRLPTKLTLFAHEDEHPQDELRRILIDTLAHPERDVIAYVEVDLPKGKEWILQRVQLGTDQKTVRLGGRFHGAFTTPELKYILENGNIKHVHQIATYENAVFFKGFVDYFYSVRQKSDKVFGLFCKMIMNTAYGKFAQKKIVLDKIAKSKVNQIKSTYIHGLETNETVIQLGYDVYRAQETDEPSTYTFTAISSLISAYARMYLVDLINVAGASNVCYCDTDSLFVTEKGYKALKKRGFVGEELGLLKLEGTSKRSIFYRPKFYQFDEDFKCKGFKKGARIIKDDGTELIAEMPQWERLKGAVREGHTDRQEIKVITKHFSKDYDKGVIGDDGYVTPYRV